MVVWTVAQVMLWHTEPTPQEFGALYVSGDWRIRHMTIGFGISHCWLYRGGEYVAEFTGKDALERGQQWAAEREARAA